jgi:hypothetical protein
MTVQHHRHFHRSRLSLATKQTVDAWVATCHLPLTMLKVQEGSTPKHIILTPVPELARLEIAGRT